MVDFRFVAVVAITSLVFLLGIFFGQGMSYYNLSELKQTQEKIMSELMGYELAYSILSKQDVCKIDFGEIQKERTALGQKVSALEEEFGPHDPKVITQTERYNIYQIKEYLFFKDVEEKCNLSTPLILYFYSTNCEDPCIAQGYTLDTLYRKYNLTTVYALDYGIDNPVLRVIKNMYNITSVPSLVINGETYNRFLKLDELERIIYD